VFFRSFPLFTILGFRVRLDVGWLLLALLVVTSTAQSFARAPFELSLPGAVATGIAFAAGLLISIVLHELSHSLVARRHGIAIRGITLFMLGGVSEMEEEPRKPWDEFFIAIVGPASSALIALACALAGKAAALAGAGASVVALISLLTQMNVGLALFNLVPAFPLDGGRVLRSVLWGARGDVTWASLVAGRLGQAFGILMIAGGLALVPFAGISALMYSLVGWFLFRVALMPYRGLVVRKRMESSTIAALVDVRPTVVPAAMSIGDLVARTGGLAADDHVPVIEDGRITGLIALARARALAPREQALRQAADLAAPLPGNAVVGLATSADEAMRRMHQLQLPLLLVVDASRLVGLVRWSDLLAFAESRS
jgi:Zn-dependent protease